MAGRHWGPGSAATNASVVIGWRELRALDDRLEEILDAESGDGVTGLVAVLGAVLRTETSGEWTVLISSDAGDREQQTWNPVVVGKDGARYDVLGAVGKILYDGEDNPSLVHAGEVLLALGRIRR